MKRFLSIARVVFFACLGICLLSAAPAEEDRSISETRLRLLVNSNPDSALLHARLASACFADGTIEGRRRATRHLRRALKIDPTNNDFRLLLAEVYFQATFWTRGVKELRTILETEPDNSDARFRLGRAYLEKAIEEWGEAWFERAITELTRVDEGHAAFPRACRKLSLCLFDLGRPDSAIASLERLPRDSLDTDALLIRGMALLKTGDPAGADKAFAGALAEMDDGRRKRYLDTDLISTPDELRRIADLRPGDVDEESSLFWRKRDPNPATRFNERFIEHISRVAFADFHFSVPRLDKPGSTTTRGEVFIRYGQPLAWFYDPFGSNVFADETITPLSARSGLRERTEWEHIYNQGSIYRSRSAREDRPRWVWRYRDFVLNFEDTFMNGDYSFPYERDWSAYTYAYLEREIPEVYETQIKKKMRVVVDALNRLDEEGNPVLDVVYACDTRGIDYQPDYEWPEGEFEVQIAVLDTMNSDLARLAVPMSLAADSSAMFRTVYPMIASQALHVPPGKAVAAVSLRSESNGAVGFSTRPIEVRTFGEGLQVSDIEFRFTEEGPVNPSRVYLYRGYAHLAFEIYNLTTDPVGTGLAEVSYRIAKRQEAVGPARRLTDYLGFTSPDERPAGIASVESSYRLRSPGARASEMIGIDLAPLSRGHYDADITVRDLLTGESVSLRTEFSIASELRL